MKIINVINEKKVTPAVICPSINVDLNIATVVSFVFCNLIKKFEISKLSPVIEVNNSRIIGSISKIPGLET